jgi:hypothetical protein
MLVQINNPWESTTFNVIENQQTGKNVIKYTHIEEDISLIIKPSRMTKYGAFRDLDKTYNQLMQLYNLDLASSKKRYGFRNKRKISKKEILPISEPLEEELIFENTGISQDILTNEDQIEHKTKSKVYRRDMKDFYGSDEDSGGIVKEYVIPNAFQQHKRNIAFSSALSKQKLLLKSDYDIPTPEHLKAFIASLNIEDIDMKSHSGFFILSVTLGCKIEDLIHLLQEFKEGSLQLKNGVITVDIDSSIFAGNYSESLAQSEDKLAFNIPNIMTSLITAMKKTFLFKDFIAENFSEGYKEFIENSVKQFPKRITIKNKQIYRYLAQYMQENGKDILTGKFATAAYTQNDTAKLAYASSRSNVKEHSRLIEKYWNELNLNDVVSSILGINTFSSQNASVLASKNFCGSSQAVETSKANVFFKALQQNIYDHNNNENLHFNLVTIYTRFAMSLLGGTRPFIESGNFTSYNKEIGIWMISEKSQDIASGTRLVPLCNPMNALLYDYQKLLGDRGLKNNFYLIIDNEYVVFSSYQAHKFLQNTHDLKNQEILEEYVTNVPLNSGRHLFTRKAIDELVNVHHISTYLGHFSASEEHFGIYSSLNVKNYSDAIKTLTTKIAQECGIKEL